jgi:predicted CXXCH cytochrome family protein
VLRGDYVGSLTCKGCHADIYEQWIHSPMHGMTRDAKEQPIVAPFDGSTFRFMGDMAVMEQRDGRRYVRVVSKHDGDELYRITKLIGGRYRFDYVGVEVADMTRGAPALSGERVLPVSYLLFDKQWRYKGYSVMEPERPGLRRGPLWRTTCIFCHNTEPYFSVTLDELFGPHSPGYQGSASIALPADKRFRFEVTNTSELRRAVDDELGFLGAPPARPADDARTLLALLMRRTRERFDGSRLVELGIGCEDCHGAARQHVEDPGHVHPTFNVESDFMRVRAPGGGAPTRAQNINRTCERCHTVLFSGYPWTWEGHELRRDPGGSSITSGEARNFLLSPCSRELSCASCHDPHTRDSEQTLDALAGPKGTRLCTSCHRSLASSAAVAAHTHHPLGSAGSQCLNCHMPKKNMGLDYSLTRYHRIGSPTDRDRVQGDRPLECALCHADKSVAFLVSTMERWYKKRYDRAALERLYGPDLSVNAIVATLERGKAHEKAVAIAVAGQNKMHAALPLVVDELDDPYPLIRYYAQKAIGEIVGQKPPLDMQLPGDELRAQAKQWLAARGAVRIDAAEPRRRPRRTDNPNPSPTTSNPAPLPR